MRKMENDIIEPFEVDRQRRASDVRAQTEHVMLSIVINIMAPAKQVRLRQQSEVRVQDKLGM